MMTKIIFIFILQIFIIENSFSQDTSNCTDNDSETKNASYIYIFGVEPDGELFIQTNTCHLTYYQSNMFENCVACKSIVIEYPKLQMPPINASFNTGFIAVYNSNIMAYNYYSGSEIYFNLYSPRVQNQRFYPNKIDSFNPYGATSFLDALFGGLTGLLKMLE